MNVSGFLKKEIIKIKIKQFWITLQIIK